MATRFNLPMTGVNFENVISVDPGAIYVARFGDVYELAFSFTVGDGQGRATGLVPLTGDLALKAHFFVTENGFSSDIDPVSVYKAEDGRESSRLLLEQTDEGGGNLSPRLGMIGSMGNSAELSICIKDGDPIRRLNPIIVGLTSCRAYATEYGFNEVFKLVGVKHPLIAD